MRYALHAEWTKLRTLPSTWWLLLAVVALTVAVGAAVASTLSVGDCPTPDSCHEDTVRMTLSGVWLGQAAIAVFAALAVTAEYGTGTIVPTLTAVPGRLRLLAAKAVVVCAVAITAGLLGVLGSLLAGRALVTGGGFPPLPLTEGATVRAAVGSALLLAVVALVSLGIATVLRDTAGSVTAALGLLYAFPLIGELIPDPVWRERVLRYGLTTAGAAIMATRDLELLPISPWPGLAVAAGYAVAALLLGGVALRTRDA